MTDYDGYVNGYVERISGGQYVGGLTVEGIDLSPIQGIYFKQDGDNYLWIKRKPIMEYNEETQSFFKREARPQLEIYMKKQIDNGTVAYKGEFMFMRFRFGIVGVWDKILGKDKYRLNLFVERLPVEQQTLLKNINANKRNNEK